MSSSRLPSGPGEPESLGCCRGLCLQSAEACRVQGVCFIPMVAESTGAWDTDPMIVLKYVAQAVAAQSGEDPTISSSLLLQELGVAIRSFRAREGVAR